MGIGDAEQPGLAAYVRVVAKRRWLVLATFLAIAVPGAILSFTGPNIYQARARIVIDQQTPELSAIRPGASVEESGEIQTHAQELRSRAVARRAVEKLKIWQAPAFALDNAPSLRDPRVLIGSARQWFFGLFASKASVARDAAPAAPGNPADQPGLVEAFLGHVSVDPIPLSRLIDVKYVSSDPRLCAEAANTLAKVYIEQDLESRFQSAKVAATWLDGQLAEQRKRVEDSLAKLQAYREAQNAPSLDDRQQNVVSQRLSELNSAVMRAKTERIAKEGAYNQLVAIQNDKAALDSFPAILSNAFIQQQKSQLAALQQERTKLSERYGEKMPEMITVNSAIQVVETRLQAEIGKIVQSVRNEYLAAAENERTLSAAYEQQKQEAIGLSRKSIDYAALEREAQSNQQIYDSLLQQAKQAGMAGEIKRSSVRLVDPANVPLGPIGPRRMQNALISILGAALFAIGLAFGLDYLSDEIGSPDEIVRHLHVPFFGFVPIVSSESSDGNRPLFNDGQRASFGEAFRRIRTNVMLQVAPGGRRVVAVTSTGPSEGKTVVTANLAVALAKAGQRVLLVDADMRKPRLNGVFGRLLEPGLSNVLSNQCSVSDAVKETTTPGLLLMAAGSGPENPAELLSSPGFKNLLTSLVGSYQWVIVDAPPVLAVTDAALVANEVGNVLFVIGVDMTTRAAAQTAIAELQRVQANILGAVLNRVNLKRDAYYYSRYYKPEYEQYYLKGKRSTRRATPKDPKQPIPDGRRRIF
jgi:polysaccharide biosynthesis transport protein